ncbi:MAG: hypothetical protein ACKVOQ_23205 [Cyclobacteriaceae bacterium]
MAKRGALANGLYAVLLPRYTHPNAHAIGVRGAASIPCPRVLLRSF